MMSATTHPKINWNQVALAMAALGGFVTAAGGIVGVVFFVTKGSLHADSAIQSSVDINTRITTLDQKIGGKLDTLGQQVVVIDERLSRIEGRLVPTRAADTPIYPQMVIPTTLPDGRKGDRP